MNLLRVGVSFDLRAEAEERVVPLRRNGVEVAPDVGEPLRLDLPDALPSVARAANEPGVGERIRAASEASRSPGRSRVKRWRGTCAKGVTDRRATPW